ncbi:zinc finger, C2H2 type [Ancylostoma caninum]|uniref:Zinc finger, C2H2 type n=1 Tax=Ancylostoma caninum TaxID=29170 RepID=A0A368GC75_ANCCA|nr:zinc finger, C2H2 type [Ancylostoma caninum]
MLMFSAVFQVDIQKTNKILRSANIYSGFPGTMVSFVLVEAETQDVLMNLIQFLAGNSLKFTVASDLRRLFARTYLDVEGYGAADVSSSSENVPASRTDVNTATNTPQQVQNAVPAMFELLPKSEPQSSFSQWANVSGHVGPIETMNSELLCGGSPYMDTYPSANGSSLESRAHQMCAAEATPRAPKRSRNHQNLESFLHSVHGQVIVMKHDEGVEKKEKLGEVVCQICGKRITMRRGNLRHHAAVVHSGIERYACPCGYATVHRNTIIRHMLKHAAVEGEKHYEYTDRLTPEEAERIRKLTEECFREYKILPRHNDDHGDE